MKMTFIIPVVICLLSLSMLRAQTEHGTCGTVGQLQEAFIPDLQRNLRWAESNPIRFRSTEYLPIKFHIVSETDGSSGVKEARILDQLAALNEDFADMDIQFYLNDCSFNYINNSVVFEDHEATIGTVMKVNRDKDAINVFIPENANRSESDLGKTLGYYLKTAFTPQGSFDSDWLVVRKSEISGNSVTLSHEIGHYFTLAHPHRGWDQEPYDPDKHGNPAPTKSPNGSFTEFQNKTNCEISGDFLCDTPPDYNFGYTWTDGCDYTGGAKDPNGELVDPEEKLFMSYFLYCSPDDYLFTPMQQAAVIASVNSDQRDYIRKGWTPTEADITTNTNLEFPINDENLDFYNDINFSWSPVSGATKYLLEISLFSNYMEGATTFSFVVNGNSRVIDDLAAGRKYYWRVRPFNCYDTAMPFTGSQSFITGTVTKTKEPGFVEGWTAGPNPVRINSSLQLTINSTEAFSGQVVWYGMDGRRIKGEASQSFFSGSNRISLSTSNLTAGVYVLALETAEGRLTKRIAVLP